MFCATTADNRAERVLVPYGPTKTIKNTLFSRKNAEGLGLLGVFASWREKDPVVLSR